MTCVNVILYSLVTTLGAFVTFIFLHFFFPKKSLRKLFLSQIKCQDLFCGLEQLIVRVMDFLQATAMTGNLESKFE